VLVGASPPPQDVSVLVTGFRSARGQVLACLTAEPAAFPDCRKDPAARHLITPVPAAGPLLLDFGALPPGHYAISLIHDENANGKLDTVMMLPREGYGFSRDAKVRFGPPSFAAAAFPVAAVPVRQGIRVRYMMGAGAQH
jgi:uncharacterized protein (DUF2141 family)